MVREENYKTNSSLRKGVEMNEEKRIAILSLALIALVTLWLAPTKAETIIIPIVTAIGIFVRSGGETKKSEGERVVK